MQIEVIKVEVTPKGKYREANVAYKGPNGKIEGKKLVSFVYKDVFEKLANASPGDLFQIKSEKVLNEKDQKEYWQWTEIATSGKASNEGATGFSAPNSVGSSGKSVARSSYETPEERAARQIYIVRQSSISNAIAFAAATSPKGVTLTPFEILEVAKTFEDHVFDKGESLTEVEVL